MRRQLLMYVHLRQWLCRGQVFFAPRPQSSIAMRRERYWHDSVTTCGLTMTLAVSCMPRTTSFCLEIYTHDSDFCGRRITITMHETLFVDDYVWCLSLWPGDFFFIVHFIYRIFLFLSFRILVFIITNVRLTRWKYRHIDWLIAADVLVF